MKNYLIRPLRFIVPVVIAFLAAASTKAATLTVNSAADAGGTCPGADCTLRQAILKAKSGDFIRFASTLKTIDLTSGELGISNKDLTIAGPGANLVTVQRSFGSGTPNFRIFNIGNGTVAISGLAIGNGSAGAGQPQGGGILVGVATARIDNCFFYGNSATTNGGAVSASGAGGKVTISNSTLAGNSAALGGGAISNIQAELTIVNCTITKNTAPGNGGGGGIHNEGTATITNSTIASNSSVLGGGIFSNGGGTISARNTIIALNSSTSQGPDVCNVLKSVGYNLIGDNSSATIVPTTGDQIGTHAAPIDPKFGPLQNNGGATPTLALLSGSTAIERGDSGGVPNDQRGFARPVNSPIIPDVGDGSDIGALEVQADVLPGCSTINRVVLNSNDSGKDSLRDVIANVCGGSTITFAQYMTGTINLTSAELLVNKSLSIVGPGANVLSVARSSTNGTPSFRIFNIAANTNVSISGLTIAHGSAASDFGGGIVNHGNLTLDSDTITNNSAAFGGGGIHNSGGTLILTGSTVSNNTVNLGAGGILNSGVLTIGNSTFSGNAANGGNGGAIVNTGTTTVTSSTIAGNSATAAAGGGIHGPAGTLHIRNSIIAANTAATGPDINGTVASQGFNLIGNSSGTMITSPQFTDQIGTAGAPIDPMIESLRDNGGSTFTRALTPGSPAIDRGDSAGLLLDQRGLPRPSDFGAVTNVSGGDGSDIGAFELQAAIPTPTPAIPGILGNISTRLQVGSGDNALFAGFIITGNVPKKVLIRSAGPSLGQFGVPGTLANPTLELHNANSTIATNDNWQATQIGGVIAMDQVAEIQSSGGAPTDNAEPAIIATLQPGSYSAIVQGAGGTQGVATVELYDLTPNNGSTLANISTRGLVQSGDNVLIGGFIVTTQPVNVLIRATGPSLIPFGVSNALANPRLDLHDANGTLAANDDWQTTETGGVISQDQAGYIQSTGLAPGNSAESALIAELAPGNYTAIVQGVSGGTGIGLIEIYTIPLD